MEAGNFNHRNVFSAYNCKVDIDLESMDRETKKYVGLPKYHDFGLDCNKESLLKMNMLRIYDDVSRIINGG